MGGTCFSIIVPCHNEATTIARKLGNCLALSCLEAVEVLVVDDHSTDATVGAVEDWLRTSRPLPDGRTVRLLRNQHAPGKNGALKTAFEDAKGSLYLITDADVLLDPDILEQARSRFEGDPRLGALCLSPRIRSRIAATVASYAGPYEAFNRWVKILQSRLDSLPILHGQAMFIRASLKIGTHEALPADDVDFAFQVRLQGSRVRYASDLPFHEEISADRVRVFQQKVRRARAVMRSFWHYRWVLLNPRYGLFGLVCFPLDFLLYFLLAPGTLLVAVVGSVWLLARYGAVGLGIVLGGVLLMLTRPLRSAALYLAILLVAQGGLIREQRPRIRWKTGRRGTGRGADLADR
jgi:cellulose synthase/poly-beta-1,6-N-acetylglucosamine synthase-like glycosyltransferase